MQAISLQTYIPIRKEPSDASEMVSQLLFGETCSVVNEQDNWVYIHTHFDNYSGWVYRKSLTLLTDKQVKQLENTNPIVIGNIITRVIDPENQHTFFLTAGCQVHEITDKQIYIFDKQYHTTEPLLLKRQNHLSEIILQIALNMINIPYLWGGRSSFGVDCSGFVQTCYKIAGISLPRDANQQVLKGKQIDSLKAALPADLAFFKNKNDKIIHVGILLNSHTIIHASQKVKISQIDDIGIIDDENKNEHSHRLAAIKRIF